jgi:hypothetical protein
MISEVLSGHGNIVDLELTCTLLFPEHILFRSCWANMVKRVAATMHGHTGTHMYTHTHREKYTHTYTYARSGAPLLPTAPTRTHPLHVGGSTTWNAQAITSN